MGEVERSEYLNDATVFRRLNMQKEIPFSFFLFFVTFFGPFAIMTPSVSHVSGSLK